MEFLTEIFGLPSNDGSFYGLLTVLFMISASLGQMLSGLKTKTKETAKEETLKVDPPSESKLTPQPIPLSWTKRLQKGLAKTRSEVWGKIENIVGSGLGDEQIEQIEELLYSADIGAKSVAEIIDHLEENKAKNFSAVELKQFLYNYLKEKIAPIQQNVDIDIYQHNSEQKQTKVIMVVGVNGAGKTTTIGKLATKLTLQGAKVVVGACDTFRAAAVDQLEVWCERSGAKMVRANEGSDPSGVVYETLQYALGNNADYCILDTAGRLHTKSNLMDELKKNKKVLQKLSSTAPDHVLLVIDSITGQNALRQAEEFNNALGLTGLVFTKCDGSSKAGNAISIVEGLKVPITYIGVGESVEDLDVFNLDEYLSALLDYQPMVQ